MARTWLVLDVPYLAWRAFHATGPLSHEGQPTEVLFGVMRDVDLLERDFATGHFVFAFDEVDDYNPRKEILPGYKLRPTVPDEVRGRVKRQIARLRDDILPRVGYRNVFSAKGYEADDVIAQVVRHLGGDEDAVLVSADHDLYQLLRPGVVCCHPQAKTVVSEESFRRDFFGLSPSAWVGAKAIAGCDSDKVPGIKGVAENTAARFLMDKIGRHTETRRKCLQFIGTDDYKRNLKLVRLPFPGCPKFKARRHPAVAQKDWDEVMRSIGITTIPRRETLWTSTE